MSAPNDGARTAAAARVTRALRLVTQAPTKDWARQDLKVGVAKVVRRSRAARAANAARTIAATVAADAKGMPPAARGRLVKATLDAGRGRLNAALDAASSLERSHPSAAAPPALRAEILRRLGRLDEALVAARSAVALAPRSPRVAKVAGICALAAGEYGEAAERLSAAVAGGPHDPGARYNLAKALIMVDRASDALDHISVAVTLEPDEPAYVELLGHALRRAGRPEEALATLEGSLKLRPGSPAVVEAFAACLLELGREDEALKMIRERIPEFRRAQLLSRAYIRLKRFEEAMPHIAEATRLDPENPWCYYMSFNALKGLGRLDEALAAIREARRLGDDPRLRENERKLAGMVRTFSGEWLPEVPGEAQALEPAARNRVLHLLERTMPHKQSGYTIRSLNTVKAQREAGLDPVVLSRLGFPEIDGIFEFDPVERVEGVHHHRLTIPGVKKYSQLPHDEYLTRYAAEAQRIVEQVRPAVLQPAPSYMNAMVGLALKRHYGLPMVYEVRGFQEDSWASRREDAQGTDFYSGRYRVETRCMLEADRIVTLAETMKEEIVSRGVNADIVHVIPNAVDTTTFVPRPKPLALADEVGLGRRVVLGYISSLVGYEGIDTLVRGVAELASRGHDVAGLVVGDGPELEPLRRLAAELGIMDRMKFTGRVPHDQILDYYALIDVFVIPRKDLRVCRLVTPLKPFEAMAMGLPLLVSDLPALAEVAAPGERGLAFTPEDPKSLAAEAEKLVADAGLRARLGETAREWAARERTWARNAERYQELYRDLLGAAL